MSKQSRRTIASALTEKNVELYVVREPVPDRSGKNYDDTGANARNKFGKRCDEQMTNLKLEIPVVMYSQGDEKKEIKQ